VHLSVRYEKARDFVVEYARNLSVGGLFVRGAHDLELLSEINVEVDLPGFDNFRLVCQVAHVVSPEMAAATDSIPGAGLAIVKSPPDFNEALGIYLRRLGRRRDFCVLVIDEECRRLLEDAGYRAVAAPPVSQLVATIARSAVPIIGVVVSRAQETAYADAAAAAGMPGVVHGLDYLEEVEELLTVLDEEL
jgi:hypothetical protein